MTLLGLDFDNIQVVSWEAIKGGNNSRIFRIASDKGQSFALSFISQSRLVIIVIA